MNAIEFVKKHGIAVAKDLAYRDKTSIGYLSVEHHNLNQDDLKQVVEAFEMVENCNGLENSKELLEEIRSDEWVYDLCTNTVVHSDYVLCEVMCIRYGLLKKAINLVEQCQ